MLMVVQPCNPSARTEQSGIVLDQAQHSLFDLRARGDWVRLRTLVMLRWMAPEQRQQMISRQIHKSTRLSGRVPSG